MKDIMSRAIKVGPYGGVLVLIDSLEMLPESLIHSAICFPTIEFGTKATGKDYTKLEDRQVKGDLTVKVLPEGPVKVSAVIFKKGQMLHWSLLQGWFPGGRLLWDFL